MYRLDDRVALVSGAGSVAAGIGNGRAIAILLARSGARVVAVDASLEAAEETCREIGAEDGQAIAVQADVTQPAQVEQAVADALAKLGRIDILVNNVGITGARGTAVEVDPDEWDHTMQVNVKSMMLTAKYCVPPMTEAGGGAIVNIASLAGLAGGNANLAYPASKGAVINMTRAMAYHHAKAGIRVNCVAPGLVLTPRVEQRGLTPDRREQRRLGSPLGTEGTAWDVAEATRYLVSDAARWVTGVVIPVDAGLSSSIPLA